MSSIRFQYDPLFPLSLTLVVVNVRNINFAQIQHLKLVEAELAALVQPKPAATAVYPPPQTKAVVPSDWPEVSKVLIARAAGDPELKTLLGAIASRNPPPEQRQMFNKHVSDIRVAILGADHRINAARSSSGPSRTETKQAKAAPLASSQPSASRAPLQPLPTNPTVKVQPQSLKRKREKPEIVANTQVSLSISPCGRAIHSNAACVCDCPLLQDGFADIIH